MYTLYAKKILFRRNLPFYRMQQSIIDLVFYLCSLFILHVCIKIEILPTSFWWAEFWASCCSGAYLQNEDWNQRSHLTRIPYDNIIRVFYSFFFALSCPRGNAQKYHLSDQFFSNWSFGNNGMYLHKPSTVVKNWKNQCFLFLRSICVRSIQKTFAWF